MALTIALECCGVGPGDDVISTPITCTATSGAITNTGATIVWADVDRQTGNIDPYSISSRLIKTPKAIVAVDWGGRKCQYNLLTKILGFDHLRVPIIRDAAHSFLATGGEDADYTAYSFGPIKHLTCGGYGGALITPPEQTRRARLLRWHGLDRRSSADFRCAQDIVEAGYRGHMTDDQAAVGLANAERIEWVVAKHRENAAFYDHVFRGLPGISSPPADPGSSYWLYTLTCDDRDGLMAHLAERGVASSPVHAINTRHSAFWRQSRRADSVPNADWFDAHQVSIPVGWWLTPEDREQVAAAVVSFACRVGATV
jgi:dTDP-4-amino-4,6-dideoxygalactose transaminase